MGGQRHAPAALLPGKKDRVAIVWRIAVLLKDLRGMRKFQYKTNRNAMAVSCPIRLLALTRSTEPGVDCKTRRRIGFSGATVVLYSIMKKIKRAEWLRRIS